MIDARERMLQLRREGNATACLENKDYSVN